MNAENDQAVKSQDATGSVKLEPTNSVKPELTHFININQTLIPLRAIKTFIRKKM